MEVATNLFPLGILPFDPFVDSDQLKIFGCMPAISEQNARNFAPSDRSKTKSILSLAFKVWILSCFCNEFHVHIFLSKCRPLSFLLHRPLQGDSILHCVPAAT